jgi:hypothetical protein
MHTKICLRLCYMSHSVAQQMPATQSWCRAALLQVARIDYCISGMSDGFHGCDGRAIMRDELGTQGAIDTVA